MNNIIFPSPRYKFLFYINPNYYGFSASSNLLLRDFGTSSCNQSTSSFACLVSSSAYTLKEFNFDDINPYFNILVSVSVCMLVHVSAR